MKAERTIYSPREAYKLAGCSRNYIQSLERSQILIPHRHDIPSDGKKTHPLVYYDITQVEILTAAVKLRQFISPKYLNRLMKSDRFLTVSEQLIATLSQLESLPVNLVGTVEPIYVAN